MYSCICPACDTVFSGFRKSSKFCSECRKDRNKLASETLSENQYVYAAYKTIGGLKIYRHAHRKLAEDILGRVLHSNEVVHHIDDDPKNNSIHNLLVLDRRSHTRLHHYLDDQRVILEKSSNDNLGNCWNSLIGPMTTVWLETTGTKVTKLWDIGQSAAERLNSQEKGEGSETCAPGVLPGKAEDDDTVQTTTV
jgi:hypothetical protein